MYVYQCVCTCILNGRDLWLRMGRCQELDDGLTESKRLMKLINNRFEKFNHYHCFQEMVQERDELVRYNLQTREEAVQIKSAIKSSTEWERVWSASPSSCKIFYAWFIIVATIWLTFWRHHNSNLNACLEVILVIAHTRRLTFFATNWRRSQRRRFFYNKVMF